MPRKQTTAGDSALTDAHFVIRRSVPPECPRAMSLTEIGGGWTINTAEIVARLLEQNGADNELTRCRAPLTYKGSTPELVW